MNKPFALPEDTTTTRIQCTVGFVGSPKRRIPLQRAVEDHVGRLDHVYAVEADLNATIRPLSTAAVRILQQNEEAAMRCVYWLAKTENPTHDYSSLIDLHLMQ